MVRALGSIVCVGFLALAAYGFSDTAADASQKSAADSLYRKLDGIDSKLDRILGELTTDNRGTNVKKETRNWGKGLSIGAKLSFQRPALEVGYTLKGKRGGAFGVFLGYEQYLIDLSGNNVDPIPSYFYMKLIAGTPILVNFLSIQGLIIPTYYLGDEFGGGRNTSFGCGVGGQFAFWPAQQVCLTLGSKAQISNRKAKTWDKTALTGPWTMYEVGTFGVTVFLHDPMAVRAGKK
jgi:hypothetical protein